MRRLLLELGVLATLVMSFLTIPLPHVVATTVWVALSSVHVARRRRIYLALLRWPIGRGGVGSSAPGQRRLVASTMLIGCAAMVGVSGFAQWAGIAAAIPWHAGSSMLLIVLATAHASRRLWRMRRRRTQLTNSKSDPTVIVL